MKRCPQCQFIYPDTDEFCDFDQSPLAIAGESEIDAATQPIVRPALSELATAHSNAIANWKVRQKLPMAAGAGLILGVIIFAVYYGVTNRIAATPTTQSQTTPAPQRPVVIAPVPAPTPIPSPTITEPQQKVTRPEAIASKAAAAHTNLSLGPVMTSSETSAKAKPVILLSGGGKLEADEVWRTKDGVWYRKNGVVTLLKKSKVKSIVTQ